MNKLEALEEFKTSPNVRSVFMTYIAEGQRLPGSDRKDVTPRQVCELMNLPYAATMRLIKGTPALSAEYRSALETWVEALAHETVAISDGVANTEEAAQVAAAKLRCDTRFRLASRLYREMFGEDVKPVLSVNISLGDVSREICELEERLGISVRPAALPAQILEVIDAEQKS